MIDVPEVGKITAIGPLAAHGEGPASWPRGEERSRPRERSPEQIKDVAQVMGFAGAELSDGVYQALSQLMAEMDKLRWELEIARRHDEYLYQLADSHPLMPVLNRRAFRRELSKAAAHVKRTETPSTLLVIDIEEGRQAKREDGAKARDAVMLRAAEIVKANLEPIDVIGGLGGDRLGIILKVIDERAARDTARRLARLLGEDPAIRRRRLTQPRRAWGASAIGPGEDAEDLLEKADMDLRAGAGYRRRTPPAASDSRGSGDDVG